jgi:hypothetical protein
LKNLLEKSASNGTRQVDHKKSYISKEQELQEEKEETIGNKKKKKYKERPFNFGSYNKRHVFLKFAYLGW